MAAWASSRKAASWMWLRAVPTMRKVSGMSPSSIRWNIPGRSLRLAKSPVAPNRTITWSSGVGMSAAWALGASRTAGPAKGVTLLTGAALHVPTELLAHRREHLVGEVGLAPGAEAFEQGGAEYACRHAFVHRGQDGPAALA